MKKNKIYFDEICHPAMVWSYGIIFMGLSFVFNACPLSERLFPLVCAFGGVGSIFIGFGVCLLVTRIDVSSL